MPAYRNLIVDEAHHLEDAITNGMSRRIDQSALMTRLRDIGACLDAFLRSSRGQIPQGAHAKLGDFLDTIRQAINEMRRCVRLYFARAA